MKHSVLSIPNDSELAGRLGKKGSVNGVTFYNRKIDDNVFIILTPSNPEAKFNAVAEIITLSGNVLVSTSKIDRLFAESLIGCSLLGRKILLTDESDASAIMQQSKLQYTVLKEDGVLDYLKGAEQGGEGELRIDIDHAFPVKGIGTVLLGIVRSGTVRVHDTLYMPSGKEVSIRSIQAQDQDVSEAGVNARVGLAIKGVEPDEFSKGDILARKAVPRVEKIKAELQVSPMIKEKGFDYSELWLVSGFSSSICKVTQSGGSYEITLSSKTAIMPKDRFLLVRKNEPRIFAAGTMI